MTKRMRKATSRRLRGLSIPYDEACRYLVQASSSDLSISAGGGGVGLGDGRGRFAWAGLLRPGGGVWSAVGRAGFGALGLWSSVGRAVVGLAGCGFPVSFGFVV